MNARSCGGAAAKLRRPGAEQRRAGPVLHVNGPRGAVGEGDAQVVGIELGPHLGDGARLSASVVSRSVSARPGLVMKTRSGRLSWSTPVGRRQYRAAGGPAVGAAAVQLAAVAAVAQGHQEAAAPPAELELRRP